MLAWRAHGARRAARPAGGGCRKLETPADAATAVSYLEQWSRAQKALMRVPASRSEDVAGDRDSGARHIPAGGEGRTAHADASPKPRRRSPPMASRSPKPSSRNRRRRSRNAAARLLEGVGQGCRQAACRRRSRINPMSAAWCSTSKRPSAARDAAAAIERRVRKLAPNSRYRGLCGPTDGRPEAGAGTDPRREPRPDLSVR